METFKEALAFLHEKGLLPASVTLWFVLSLVVVLAVTGDSILNVAKRRTLGDVLFSRGNWHTSVSIFFQGYVDWFDVLFKVRRTTFWGFRFEVPSLLRSAIASMLALAIIALCWWAGWGFRGGLRSFIVTAPFFFFGTLLTNVIPDYLSLTCTRVFMERIVRSRNLQWKLFWLLVDTAVTIGIALLVFAGALVCLARFDSTAWQLGNLRPWNLTPWLILRLFWAGLSFSSRGAAAAPGRACPESSGPS